MRVLNKKEIRRMAGRGSSPSYFSSGGGGGGGGISLEDVDAFYINKDFFAQMFVLHVRRVVTVNGGTPTVTDYEATPNAIIDTSAHTDTDPDTGDVTVTQDSILSIEAKVTLYSDDGISALGLSPGGGGGGGASSLAELTDVSITDPQNGEALIYNAGTGTWVNGAGGGGGGGGGSVTSVGMTVPAGLQVSGSPVTASGTLAVTLEAGHSIPFTADVNKGIAAYGWGNHANAGYATQQWVNQQGYATPTDLSAYLPLAGGLMTGQMTRNIGATWVQGYERALVVNTNGGQGNYKPVIAANAYSGDWSVGTLYNTTLQRSELAFVYHYKENAEDKYRKMCIDDSMNIETTGHIRIGDAMLVWEGGTSSLKLIKADGTACNFYTTGGVSALNS